jgi:hypothetical protein
LDIVLSLHDDKGRVVNKATTFIEKNNFVGIATFKFYASANGLTITKIRVYPTRG